MFSCLSTMLHKQRPRNHSFTCSTSGKRKIPIKSTFFSFYHSNNLTPEERENAHELTNLISQLGYEAPILSEEKNSLDLEQKRYEMKIAEEKRVWVHTTRKQVQKYRYINSR